ncbi:nucleoside triphosphate pyrophosphohydrolase [Aldersonia kunmingensis]|uniref:nucleoside triphosphate pyrophosphohydrolase n=1 Tax=Aldersonia kunmingensis TaxID=408066 RepID=UPI000829C642|nr:nucleoside triphosphate pyrophosphohydrolase [Aldersonia kunmingensis]
MGKLVRDGIPDLIRADGRTPATRTLSSHAFLAALLDKLVEEAAASKRRTRGGFDDRIWLH